MTDSKKKRVTAANRRKAAADAADAAKASSSSGTAGDRTTVRDGGFEAEDDEEVQEEDEDDLLSGDSSTSSHNEDDDDENNDDEQGGKSKRARRLTRKGQEEDGSDEEETGDARNVSNVRFSSSRANNIGQLNQFIINNNQSSKRINSHPVPGSAKKQEKLDKAPISTRFNSDFVQAQYVTISFIFVHDARQLTKCEAYLDLSMRKWRMKLRAVRMLTRSMTLSFRTWGH